MTFDELNKKLGGGESASDWHQHANGGGWVHKKAKVDATAFVGENAIVWAWVSGNAWVSGDAQVYGNAWVYGDAQVSGDAWVKSPLFIIGSKYSLTNAKHGHIKIGCRCETFAWWKKNGRALAKSEGFTEAEIKEYAAYVKLFMEVGK